MGFLVPGAILVTGKNGEGQAVLVQAQVLGAGQELPAPGNGFLLEIIAQAPVAQHFKEGQVAGIAHVVDVAGADALLHVGEAGASGVLGAHEIGHQGMHARGGKEHRGIIFGNDGGGLNAGTALALHEFQEHFAQLRRGKLLHGVNHSFASSRHGARRGVQPRKKIASIIAKSHRECNRRPDENKG